MSRHTADGGLLPAMFAVGRFAEHRGDLTQALVWYRKAANAGFAAAMTNLGAILERQPHTIDEAEEWYRKAAAAHNSDAMYNLGALAERAGDVAEAIMWYQDAADAGDKDALARIDSLVKKPENIESAIAWYAKAAELGKSGAMANLGVLEQERGDVAAATQWSEQAANAGVVSAWNNLGNIALDCGDTRQGTGLVPKSCRRWVRASQIQGRRPRQRTGLCRDCDPLAGGGCRRGEPRRDVQPGCACRTGRARTRRDRLVSQSGTRRAATGARCAPGPRRTWVLGGGAACHRQSCARAFR